MARPRTDKREQLITVLTELFYEYGYDGTSLALITTRTGLGRASLYHHFPGGKEEMARAVLARSDRWTEIHVDEVIEGQGSPQERLAAYLKAMNDVHTRPQQLTPSNAFGIGVSRELFGEGLRDRMLYRNASLALLLEACGVAPGVAIRRAWEARIMMEGALVCARQTSNMQLYRSVMGNLYSFLLAPTEAGDFLPESAEASGTVSRAFVEPENWLPDCESE